MFPKLSAEQRGTVALTNAEALHRGEGKAGSLPITGKRLNGSGKDCHLMALC